MDVPSADASQAVRPPTRQAKTGSWRRPASATWRPPRAARSSTSIGTGDSIFERIASQTSAYYLLGVEEAAGDRDGKRHRIDVEVRRRDVTLHSRRAFVLSSAADARRTPEENLADALRSPFAVAELPLRATTFVTQDPDSDKVRLMVAAEVGAAGAMPAEYTLGYALIDRDGKVVGAFSERKALTPADGRPTAALEYLRRRCSSIPAPTRCAWRRWTRRAAAAASSTRSTRGRWRVSRSRSATCSSATCPSRA